MEESFRLAADRSESSFGNFELLAKRAAWRRGDAVRFLILPPHLADSSLKSRFQLVDHSILASSAVVRRSIKHVAVQYQVLERIQHGAIGVVELVQHRHGSIAVAGGLQPQDFSAATRSAARIISSPGGSM